jgi:hypothetical protein
MSSMGQNLFLSRQSKNISLWKTNIFPVFLRVKTKWNVWPERKKKPSFSANNEK